MGCEWISALDVRPEEHRSVLIYVTGGLLHHGQNYIDIGMYLNGIWRHSVGEDDLPVVVSHWMELPKAPDA